MATAARQRADLMRFSQAMPSHNPEELVKLWSARNGVVHTAASGPKGARSSPRKEDGKQVGVVFAVLMGMLAIAGLVI